MTRPIPIGHESRVGLSALALAVSQPPSRDRPLRPPPAPPVRVPHAVLASAHDTVSPGLCAAHHHLLAFRQATPLAAHSTAQPLQSLSPACPLPPVISLRLPVVFLPILSSIYPFLLREVGPQLSDSLLGPALFTMARHLSFDSAPETAAMATDAVTAPAADHVAANSNEPTIQWDGDRM